MGCFILKIVSQLESTIATLQSNLDYHKSIYRASCDIDDFDESERVAKSARESIQLFKGWIKTLENLNAEVQEHRELIVCGDEEEPLERPVVRDIPSIDTTSDSSTSDDADIIHILCKDTKGKYSANGEYNLQTKSLTVLQGSRINPTTNLTRNQGTYYRNSTEYVSSDYVLKKDVTFNTASDAGVFVTGYSVNGKEIWKDANGVTLQKILSKTSRTAQTDDDTTTPTEESMQEPTNTNKISFKILKQQISVDSYVEVYYRVLEVMLIKYPFKVGTLSSVLSLNVERISVFSFNENDIRFRNIPIKRRLPNNLWVGIVDDKKTILDNIDKILVVCNCPKDQFKIL